VFIDETGTNTKMVGTRARLHTPGMRQLLQTRWICPTLFKRRML
jgi:hypothetical protein